MLGRAVTRSGAPEAANLAEMPGAAVICRCNTVTKSAIVGAFRAGADSVAGGRRGHPRDDRLRLVQGRGRRPLLVAALVRARPSTPSAPPTATTPEPVSAPAALTEGAA